MTELKKSKSELDQTESQSNPPGEYWIIIVLLIITGMFFFEALKLPGIFQGHTHKTGTMPQIMSTTVLVLILFVAVQMIRNCYKQGSIKETLDHLFSKEVIILIIAVISYGFLLKYFHFRITSLLFLWGCMYLFDQKQPLHKLIISVAVLLMIIFIFSTIFRVLLP